MLIAVFSILLGIAFLSAGYGTSWGFFVLAGIPIFWMAFYAYIAALPIRFPETDDPESAGQLS